jgi:hypothetical protein
LYKVYGSQPFVARGNQSYPKFWVVTDDPRYPGYLTLTLAPDGGQNRYSDVIVNTSAGFGGDIMGPKPSRS